MRPVHHLEGIVREIFAEPIEMVALFGDVQRATEIFGPATTDDVELAFVGSPGLVTEAAEFEVSHGREELARGWSRWLEPYSSYRAALEAVTVIDDTRVLAEVSVLARTGMDGVELRQQQAAVFTFEGGLISRWEAWLHAEDARAAFGVRRQG